MSVRVGINGFGLGRNTCGRRAAQDIDFVAIQRPHQAPRLLSLKYDRTW